MKKRQFVPMIIWALILAMSMFSCSRAKPDAKPNVLFIFIDDLNDWALHPEGHPDVLVPNIDKLARQSVSFTNAHVAVPRSVVRPGNVFTRDSTPRPSTITILSPGPNPQNLKIVSPCPGIFGIMVTWSMEQASCFTKVRAVISILNTAMM